jgi:hypothetical protein
MELLTIFNKLTAGLGTPMKPAPVPVEEPPLIEP